MSNAPIPSRMLYTVAESRQLLGGISNSFFYALVARHELEICKLGRRSFVPAEAIEKLIKNSCRLGPRAKI